MKKLFFLLLVIYSTSTFALKPSREYAFYPEDLGLNSKEWHVKTEDNYDIYAWRITPAKGATSNTVIIADDGVGNMADNFDIAGLFLGAGYNVVMFDYRGYGKSQDARVNEKMYLMPTMAKDLDAVITEVKKMDAKQIVTVYGIGIGGGLAIGVGSNNIKVRRIIADAPYPDFETVKKRLMDVKQIDLMIPPGAEKTLFEPRFAIQDKGQHIEGYLLIVSANDKVITEADMKSLQALRKKSIEIYAVPDAENKDNFTSDKNEYFNHVKSFLEKKF